MERSSVEAVVGALEEARVRYLVAGGLAVVAHGYVRFTADVDIVLDLAEDNVLAAAKALSALGYRPRAPVSIEDLARPAERRRWRTDKGMIVFSIWSPSHPATEIDVFLEQPFDDFERALSSAVRVEVAPGVSMTVVGREDLIALKRRAGRPRDLDDAEHLERLGEVGHGRS